MYNFFLQHVCDHVMFFHKLCIIFVFFLLFILQINDLNQVPVPVMLLPDDFKANTKIKVQNHLFNK